MDINNSRPFTEISLENACGISEKLFKLLYQSVCTTWLVNLSVRNWSYKHYTFQACHQTCMHGLTLSHDSSCSELITTCTSMHKVHKKACKTCPRLRCHPTLCAFQELASLLNFGVSLLHVVRLVTLKKMNAKCWQTYPLTSRVQQIIVDVSDMAVLSFRRTGNCPSRQR